MFICCNTKPKKDKPLKNGSTAGNSDAESIRQNKGEEEIHKEPVQDITNKSPIAALNQQELQLQEIQNKVNRIKEYRNQGKLSISIDEEKSFVTSLIEADQPTIYFVEYKWAVNYTTFLEGRIQELPKNIDNTKLLNEENFQKELVVIRSVKDSQLLPGLQPDKHYVLLNEKSWTFIHLLYSGGPTMKIELAKPVMSPDISNDGQTNFTSPTPIPSKITIEPLVEVPKQEPDVLEDSEKSTNRTVIASQKAQQTNSIKIQPKIYELPYVGLQNPKYYCYMNSVLQCLLGVKELNDFLLKQSRQQNKKFSMAYQDLLRVIQNSSPGTAISIEKFQNMCLNKFKYSQQQDAHEFLLYLLTEFQEEQLGEKIDQKEEFSNAQEAWDVYKNRNHDIITNLFVGQVASKSHCSKCKEITEGFDPILDLNLPLKKHLIPRELKLFDSLQNYFNQEQVNDVWKCEKCQFLNKSFLRNIQVTQTPKYLILHLKRFTQYPKNQKIAGEVIYPEILDIKEFCVENVEQTKYTLKSVISHMGQLNGGHYVAYAQRQNQWFHFDDNIVTKDKNNQHLSDQGAYIIFYELM